MPSEAVNLKSKSSVITDFLSYQQAIQVNRKFRSQFEQNLVELSRPDVVLRLRKLRKHMSMKAKRWDGKHGSCLCMQAAEDSLGGTQEETADCCKIRIVCVS